MTPPAQRFLFGALALLALGGLGVFVAFTSDFRPGSGSTDPIGGPFVLTRSDGMSVTDRFFRGRWMLVYFGYTHCPDVCPTTLLAMAKAIEALGPLAANVQPIFITIDPERDTPEVMAELTAAFDTRILGLTGKPTEIAAVAKQYRVFFKKVISSDAGDYFMEHSSYIYVMGPDGRYVTLFSHGETASPDTIAARLRELLLAGPAHGQKTPGAARPDIALSSNYTQRAEILP